MTHIAAIVLGVGLTLYIVQSRKGKEFHEHATVSSSVLVPPVTADEAAGSSGAATKKNHTKKKTKHNKKTATARHRDYCAFDATPSIPSKKEVAEAHAEEAAAALLAEEEMTPTNVAAAASTGGKKKKNKKKKNKPKAAAAAATTNDSTSNENLIPAPTVTKAPTPTAAPISVPFQPRVVVEEEAWATIPVQKKKKETRAGSVSHPHRGGRQSGGDRSGPERNRHD